MIKEFGPGFRLALLMTVLTGLLYPALMTGISELIFPHQANGSLVTVNGTVVGSSLIAQGFSKPEYFHPRPSAAGNGYDATASSGTNLGPTSAKLLRGTTKTDDKGKDIVDFDGLSDRIVHYCVDNGIAFKSSIPIDQFKDAQGNLDDVKLIKAFNHPNAPLSITPQFPLPQDAVTASASGLDPHISPANAEIQAARVAKARRIQPGDLTALIAQATERPEWGFIGEPRVNVLLLNVALDQRFPASK